jgi:preprotein translocase subunit YajC
VDGLAGLLPFALIALVFWLLIVRPQRRRQQELTATQNALGPGSEVMLGSGFFGTVVSVEDDAVHLEIAPGTTVKVARQAVVRVLSGATEPADGTATESASETEPHDVGTTDDEHH